MKSSKILLLSSAVSLALVNIGNTQTRLADLTDSGQISEDISRDSNGLPEVNLPTVLDLNSQRSNAPEAPQIPEVQALPTPANADEGNTQASDSDEGNADEGASPQQDDGVDALDPIAAEIKALDLDEEPMADEEAMAEPENSSLALEIETLLRNPIDGFATAEREALIEFYNARGFLPYFSENPEAQSALNDAIANVSDEGLPPSRYEFADENLDAAHKEVFDALKFIRYGHDMERGIISPRSLGSEFDFAPDGRSYAELLADFRSSQDKAGFMKSLEPNDPAYPAMKAELARIHSIMGEDIADPIIVPEGATLRLGDESSRVTALRARLEQLGIDTGVGFNSDLFDEGLGGAVKEFQAGASLSADGVVGPATINVLNSGPSDHLRKVLIGMERLRWGPQNTSGRQIYVNLANFTAQVRDNNQKSFETIVVVGKNSPEYRTPEFNDTMTHLIINPKWNVPESISVKEYLPKIQRDPSILARNNIVMRIKGSGQEVSPYQIDMRQFTVDDFPFLLQQQSGDGNALGNVKFMFPNSHNIYLHDTPSKSFFNRSVRTFSHGCVRVRDPEDLATTLLTPQYDDPRGTYRNFLASGKERQVNFQTPIPIYLTYFTAYLNDSGTISYTGDAYGRDRLVASALRDKGLDI